MVRGIDSFKEWFRDYRENYVIIGGTACDLLLEDAGVTARATKDIDMVLIVENLSAEFGRRFWEYIEAAGYKHINQSTGKVRFYRFSSPEKKGEYPFMIELLARRIE